MASPGEGRRLLAHWPKDQPTGPLRRHIAYVRQPAPQGRGRLRLSRRGERSISEETDAESIRAAGRRFRRLACEKSDELAEQQDTVSGVAGRYASALFSLAHDERKTDEVADALAAFDALIVESADLQRLVRSPVFSAHDQIKALDADSRARRRRPESPPISSSSSPRSGACSPSAT